MHRSDSGPVLVLLVVFTGYWQMLYMERTIIIMLVKYGCFIVDKIESVLAGIFHSKLHIHF